MTRRLAKVPTLGLLAILAGVSPFTVRDALGQSAPRVGYVDAERVLTRSAAGVAAREQIERDKAVMQKDIDGKLTEVQKLKEEIEKKGALLTADARREKQETLERKARDLQRLRDDYLNELKKKDQERTYKILHEITGIVERVGKQKGFLLILERRSAGVIYASPEADLTDEIIKMFDQEAAKGKK